MKLKYSIAVYSFALSISASAQIELGYGSQPVSGWGDANSVVTPYVSFPEAYVGTYAGNSITSVSIAVMEEASNVYIYIKNRPEDQKYIYRQKVDKLSPGWNDVLLDSPFSIEEGSPIAIGYKASFAKAGGVAISDEKIYDADFVYYNSQNRWATTGGSICIKAKIEGENLPADALMLFPIKVNVYDRWITLSGSVMNIGNNDIDNCLLRVSIDGQTVDELSRNELKKGQRESYFLDVDYDDYGTHTLTIETVEVNGKPSESNAINTVSTSFTLKPSVYAFSRRIVCEEYTGTWCGFCPRGMVGLETMREKYGEHFIPIAVHGYDPMQIDDETISYDAFIETVSGAPYCRINRQFGGDPYYDIQSLFDLASNLPLPLAVDLACGWNDDRSAIEATTTYLSGDDLKNPKYNIVYTITESGITSYAQTNYYSGGSKGELPGWIDKSDPTFDVVYNDVARALIGGYDGMECRYESMEAMMPYTHKISIPLPSNVTNPDNIKVIAQIIDVTSGRIVNAAEAVPASSAVNEIKNSDLGISLIPGAFSVNCDGKEGCTLRVYGIDGSLYVSTICHSGDLYQLPGGIFIVELTDASGALYRKKIKL